MKQFLHMRANEMHAPTCRPCPVKTARVYKTFLSQRLVPWTVTPLHMSWQSMICSQIRNDPLLRIMVNQEAGGKGKFGPGSGLISVDHM